MRFPVNVWFCLIRWGISLPRSKTVSIKWHDTELIKEAHKREIYRSEMVGELDKYKTKGPKGQNRESSIKLRAILYVKMYFSSGVSDIRRRKTSDADVLLRHITNHEIWLSRTVSYISPVLFRCPQDFPKWNVGYF